MNYHVTMGLDKGVVLARFFSHYISILNVDEGIPLFQLNIRGILYADDVVRNHTQIQYIMFNLESFCFTNELAVNTRESKVMLCGPAKIEMGYKLNIKERFWKM